VLNAVKHRCVKNSLAGSAVACLESTLNRHRHSYDKIDAFIGPSRFVADIAAAMGIDPAAVHVIPNFVDAAGMPVEDLPRDGFLFAGRLEATKGVRELIAGFEALPGRSVLTIVGRGSLEPEVTLAARRSARINFEGQVPGERVMALLRQTRALVLPAVAEENCPMSILEARVAGTPIVASDRGGIPELVTDGVDGLLFDVADRETLTQALRTLDESDELVSRFGEVGRERLARDHTPARHYDRLMEVYASAEERAARRKRSATALR
jgi:glycosyltransferase involved in cell wall biosynthesis